MNAGLVAFDGTHRLSGPATRPSARLARRLAALLLLAGDGPAASSRLAGRRASRALGRVQLRSQG